MESTTTMWAWIRTPRGSTTTALVVAVILALFWFDPWDRPPFSRLLGDQPSATSPAALTGVSVPASPAASGSVPVAALEPNVGKDANAAPAPAAVPVVRPPGPAAEGTAVPVPSTAAGVAPTPAPAAAASGDVAAPSFDIVRVEPDGSTVVAGRGEPGSEVVLLDGDKPLARAAVDATGQFALVPPTLGTGDHALALEIRRGDHAPVRSTQTVAVSVARAANTRPLVALLSPDKPAEILSDGAANAPPTVPSAKPGSGAAPAASTVPVPLAIQSVEARQAGQFLASGVAKPGTSNRVYLNGSFVAEVTAGANGHWSVEIQKGMAPGRYLVRADQVEPSSGKVTSRVEVPFDYPVGGAPDGKPSRLAQAGGTSPQRDGGVRANGAPVVSTTAGSRGPKSGSVATGVGGGTTSGIGTDGQDGTPAPQVTTASANPVASSPVASGPVASSPAAVDRSAPNTGAGVPGTAGRDLVANGGTMPADLGAGARAGKGVEVATTDAPQGAASAVVPDLKTATVLQGDSLWRISRKLLGRGIRYTEIYASNNAQIKDPALIYPGQVFVVPTQRID